MSKYNDISFNCPRCQRQSVFRIWQSVNVDLDPWLKPKVIDGSLFNFQCQFCGFSNPVGYSVLYHDQRNQYMIWLVPEDENGKQEYNPTELNLYARSLPGYRLRLVTSLNRLKEKILIFDRKLDDRAIEMLKRYIWSAYLEDQGVENSRVFFSDSIREGGYPAIELVFFTLDGNERTIKTSGKNGYPHALELLKEYEVSEKEETKWRTIDHTYWDLAKRGEG